MYCCPNCFSDIFLKSHIQANYEKTGSCCFCKSTEIELIKPISLFDRFESLIELYEKNKNGNLIIELIQNDWKVLNKFSFERQKKLLKLISDNNNLFRCKYKPKFLKDKNNIEQWEKFREELKHSNRFFPNDAPEKKHLEPFAPYIGCKYKKDSSIVLYRARINESDEAFELDKMGKPPKINVSSGRANPIGIPYLYVASTAETAISEVRPHKGEFVTVAEYTLVDNLELADLRDPVNTISPFELNDTGEGNELEMLYKNMPFLILLGEELSKPIIPREASLEYLSSQYLCELIKKIGFHGIIYKSSVSQGFNYVIFNDEKLQATKTIQYKITNTYIKSEIHDKKN